MDEMQDRMAARIAELERQLQERQREADYYRRLAQTAGDERLREAESYSRLVAGLKERIWVTETQHAALLKLHEEIERISVTDDLTRLLNRRGVVERFQRLFADCQCGLAESDAARGCACALLDIDGFRTVNDRYGNSAGDELLRRFGNLLRTCSRASDGDIIGRFGGKRFILVLPHRAESAALDTLEKLLERIARFRFRITLDTKIQVTASAGISSVARRDTSVLNVIDRADEALRRARAQGPSKIVLRAA